MNKNYNIYRCIIVIVILLCFYYILTGEINESFVSFNEKVKYRMLSKSFNSPKWVKYIDKLKFKEYARKKNVDTPKTLGIFSNPYEIKYDDIPNNCVIKLNNGSGRNIIIKDKTIIGGNLPKNLDLKNDWHIIQNKLNYWKKPYNPKREQQYKYITPLIYFEELLEPEPIEYKLHVFNGKVKIIYLADNKVVGSCRRYYDVNWNYIGCYDNIYKECNYEIKDMKLIFNWFGF